MYDAGVSPPGEGEERAQATGGAAEAPARAGVDRLGKRRRVERLAVGYFKRRAGVGMGARPLHGDAVHFLNPEERRNLRRIERNAVLRAGAAGALLGDRRRRGVGDDAQSGGAARSGAAHATGIGLGDQAEAVVAGGGEGRGEQKSKDEVAHGISVDQNPARCKPGGDRNKFWRAPGDRPLCRLPSAGAARLTPAPSLAAGRDRRRGVAPGRSAARYFTSVRAHQGPAAAARAARP